MQIQTFDNGEIVIEGYNQVTPDGCSVQVFKHATADIFITVQCQCLERGEPYQVSILNCPQHGDFQTTVGKIEFTDPDNDDPMPVYVNLDAWLTLHLGH